MMRRKPVHVFLLHAAFLLALIGVLPGSREIYPRVFHAAGNTLLGSMGDGLSVRFQWIDPSLRADAADTRMLGREAGKLEYRWRAVYSSHRRGFWPSATFAALMLATPMSRRRLAVTLPLGLLLFNVFFVLQVAAFAWVLFGATGSTAGPSWAWLANPTRGLDLAGLNALLRRLLGPQTAGGPPSAAKAPPADAEAEVTPSDDGPPGSDSRVVPAPTAAETAPGRAATPGVAARGVPRREPRA
jgi:hypothetical protein